MMSSAIYAAAPFLPMEADNKKVKESYIGLMLSAYSIASCTTGPFIGKVIFRVG